MTTHRLAIDLPADAAIALADHLADDAVLGCDAAGAFDPGGGPWRVEAYFPDGPAREALAGRIRTVLGDVLGAAPLAQAIAGMSLGPLDAGDWTAIGLDAVPPVVAGRFRVFGEHNRPSALRRCDLVIAASTAFGTGDHASTALALGALDGVLKRSAPNRILDVGTGTGILALAAARARPAVRLAGTDIDPVAIRMAGLNRRANAIAAPFALALSARLDAPAIRRFAPFDLVLANILPDPLVALAPSIVRSLRPGASLVLAGLRVGEAPRLVSTYRRAGLVLKRRTAIKEWACLTFERPPTRRALP